MATWNLPTPSTRLTCSMTSISTRSYVIPVATTTTHLTSLILSAKSRRSRAPSTIPSRRFFKWTSTSVSATHPSREHSSGRSGSLRGSLAVFVFVFISFLPILLRPSPHLAFCSHGRQARLGKEKKEGKKGRLGGCPCSAYKLRRSFRVQLAKKRVVSA